MIIGSKPTIYGWGIVDVTHHVQPINKITGKRDTCPYYEKWKQVIQRAKSEKFKQKRVSYKDSTVANEWQYLSNFIKWVDSQRVPNWQLLNLDKDILVFGNKEYAPDKCVFVTTQVNNFLIDRKNKRGNCLIGVNDATYKSTGGRFEASCKCPFTGKRGYIGLFKTELEAHKAWQAKKHEYACQLADMQEDERVAKALRERYAPDKDWSGL